MRDKAAKITLGGIMCFALLGLVACGGATSPLPQNASVREVAVDRVIRANIGREAQNAPTVTPAEVRAALTPDVLAQLTAPTLFAELNGAVSLAQLVATNGTVTTWLTEDNLTLSTRDGMLVATRGLGFDIMESDVEEPLAIIQNGGSRATRSHSWLNGEGVLIRRSFDCEYTRSGSQVLESCFAINLSFENAYTIANGRIRASRQWLGPVLGDITLEQLTF